MRTLLLTTAAVSFLCFNMSAHALNETCYYPTHNPNTGQMEDGAQKPIHIDIQRPDSGKMSESATYNASGSRTPSGQIGYEWKEGTGGLQYTSFSDAIITVTPIPKNPGEGGGRNVFTKLTIHDPVCGFSQSTEFNVNFYE
ncbi:hypothetical protein ACIPQ1_18560 [Pseudomonas sp. LARHCG127]|uniref:hypothetical protein n=1 Tax=unclassified Pseudomonas TaxID=196821 RepID=UPI0020333560|nr:hypothetical protein [Pseudomonas sp. CG7]MCM2460738.1 hypothetical protein [Pseudomonas sp. CG7]